MRKSLEQICEEMMSRCLSPKVRARFGTDNMTIIVIALLNGRTMDEWYNWMAERVEEQIGYHMP